MRLTRFPPFQTDLVKTVVMKMDESCSVSDVQNLTFSDADKTEISLPGSVTDQSCQGLCVALTTYRYIVCYVFNTIRMLLFWRKNH